MTTYMIKKTINGKPCYLTPKGTWVTTKRHGAIMQYETARAEALKHGAVITTYTMMGN